ncbi:hypothetical protein KCU65_g7870, partial [Aureobasidium melanogenum]
MNSDFTILQWSRLQTILDMNKIPDGDQTHDKKIMNREAEAQLLTDSSKTQPSPMSDKMVARDSIQSLQDGFPYFASNSDVLKSLQNDGLNISNHSKPFSPSTAIESWNPFDHTLGDSADSSSAVPQFSTSIADGSASDSLHSQILDCSAWPASHNSTSLSGSSSESNKHGEFLEELGLDYLFAEPSLLAEADLPSHVQQSPVFIPLQQKQHPTSHGEELSSPKSLRTPEVSAGTEYHPVNYQQPSGISCSNPSVITLNCSFRLTVNSGHESIVRILLDEGEDINKQDVNGSTALHIAVLERQDAILQMLLEKRPRLDIADVMGQTPAHLAIYTNSGSGLKLLLEQRTKNL